MAGFRLRNIAELARQMEFTPSAALAEQLKAAEDLLHELDVRKGYPADFVVYRITGYRPKNGDPELLTGLALQHDLCLLIERLSESLDQATSDLAEPVLNIEDVCERFNVTSKTIQRWRRRGLPSRRFIFPDGRKRVGFLLSSVERFLARNEDHVAAAAGFSQVGEAERDEILRRARRLAANCHCCVAQITRRIARKLGRSRLTVLHVIRKHDREHPDRPIFAQVAETVSDGDREQILRGWKQGVPLGQLARRMCRPRSAIYRVLIDDRLAALARLKVKFIDDPLYRQPDAEAIIDSLVANATIDAEATSEDSRIPRDLPPDVADLCREPPLGKARERALFLKFNFHRYQFVQARRRLDPELATSRDLNVMESHLRKAMETKNRIVAANIRLVVSVARKHLRAGLTLGELISEGNLTLIRAVDSFDVHRGFRFSTYATLSLMKAFARAIPRLLKLGGADHADAEDLREVADARQVDVAERLVRKDELRRLMGCLDERERRVVCAAWGLGDEPADEAASRLGLSRVRMRQIEAAAMAKLRAAAAE